MPPIHTVWGVTATQYRDNHGGKPGDLCVDEHGEQRCLNQSTGGRVTWRRGRANFGAGKMQARLGATCNGPCRIPGHAGERGVPRAAAATDWGALDTLGRRLYLRRNDLGLSDVGSLPRAVPGLLLQVRAVGPPEGEPAASTHDTAANELVGATGAADRVVFIYYRIPAAEAADPAGWLRRIYPAAAACGARAWMWTPPAGERVWPVSAFGGTPPRQPGLGGVATDRGLGSPVLRSAYRTMRRYAEAYAAAWGVSRRAALARWLWVYDRVGVVQWRHIEPARIQGECAALDPHDIPAAIQFLTEDGMPPPAELRAVDLAAAGGAGGEGEPADDQLRDDEPQPAVSDAPQMEDADAQDDAAQADDSDDDDGAGAGAGGGPAVNRFPVPALAVPAAGSFNDGINLADNGSIVANNSTVIIINGGSYDASGGVLHHAGRPGGGPAGGGGGPAGGGGAQRPPDSRRRPWSWWLNRSMQRVVAPGMPPTAVRLMSLLPGVRNEALRWLINVRGLTYATGMAPDEYVAALDSAANRDRFGAGAAARPAPVGEYPSAEWAARIPYAMPPIATLLALAQEDRRNLLR